MDAASLLLDRMRAALDRLHLVHSMVQSWPALSKIVTARCARLDHAISSSRPSADAWHTLADWEQADSAVFRDILAYAFSRGDTAFARSGPATLAAELTAELCQKVRLGEAPFVVPDVDDSFSDCVEVIRFRYPPDGIWDVPIVAHELGHFAAYRLTALEDGMQRPQPVRDFISNYLLDTDRKLDKDQRTWRHWLNECFADAFATYSVGPCYAASSLLLRFDVTRASIETPTHPSNAARAITILETLRQMNRATRRSPYTVVINELQSRWSELLTLADENCSVDWARDVALGIYRVLEATAGAARYDSWNHAAETLQHELTRADEVPSCDVSVRDLLNAAWLARARGNVDPNAVSDRAVKLWRSRIKK
jgi:hypothetical protein